MSPDNDTSSKNANPPFKIRGNWAKRALQLQERFPQLTDDDLQFEPGNEDELLNRMGKRLNKNRSEIINLIHKDQDNIN